MDIREEKRLHLIHCNIAGFTFWDGCIAFENLKLGTKLQLVRDSNNRYDSKAVALYWNEYKLGYIPRTHNDNISMFLDMGHDDIFETRISRISSNAEQEKQVYINIYIIKKEKHEITD
jgi:hypothetical protein